MMAPRSIGPKAGLGSLYFCSSLLHAIDDGCGQRSHARPDRCCRKDYDEKAGSFLVRSPCKGAIPRESMAPNRGLLPDVLPYILSLLVTARCETAVGICEQGYLLAVGDWEKIATMMRLAESARAKESVRILDRNTSARAEAKEAKGFSWVAYI